jgi:hypothetical protein
MMLSRFAVLSSVFVLGLTCSASGQPADKTTHFTFSQPVELPGPITLEPGEYTFRLVDINTGRRTVQVMTKDRKQQKALLLTIPNERLQAPAKPELRFMEVAEGQPQAAHVWWYNLERTGYEFVYPKSQAERLSRATGMAVAMTESPMRTEEEMTTAKIDYTDVSTEPAPASTAGVGDTTPAATSGVAAQAQAESTTASAAPARTALPRTASPLPLAGLIGFLSLLGAAGLRRFC